MLAAKSSTNLEMHMSVLLEWLRHVGSRFISPKRRAWPTVLHDVELHCYVLQVDFAESKGIWGGV